MFAAVSSRPKVEKKPEEKPVEKPEEKPAAKGRANDLFCLNKIMKLYCADTKSTFY